MDLSLLAINAAEELQRLRLKKDTDLRYAKELSELIKKDFIWRHDYSKIFSEAYHLTYSKEISQLPNENSKPQMAKISKKLEFPSNSENKELERLVDFCVKLSDYSAAHEEEIRKLKTSPCF